MKDLNFTELFCEIFSGLYTLLIITLIFDCFGYLDIIKTIQGIMTLPIFTITIVCSYLIGLIVDAIGLSLGEWFFDEWVSNEDDTPTKEEYAKYYKSVSETSAKYRDLQWSYYSLYRNIFLLSVVGIFFYMYKSGIVFGGGFAVLTTIIIIGINACIFYAMRTLLNLYYKITKGVAAESNTPTQ